MTEQTPQWNDERVESIIGNLLRLGVGTAAALVLLGGLWYLFRHGMSPVAYGSFQGEPPEYRSIPGVVRSVGSLRGRSLIQLGLLLLIATPVARVAFSVWAFAREHDRTYVVVTLIVLAILLYSLVGGH
jgi:uncharacterized membrane protein